MPERFLIVKKYLWARVGLFAVAAVAVYGWSALHNGFVGYDDPRLIIDNPLIRTPGPSTWATIFTTYEAVLYVPLLFISYQIDFLLGGLTPAVYHIHNLTLHTVTAFLVSVLLFQLTGRRVAAVLCGMLFLVHPLNTEVVAWASARKDALMGLFAVLSVVAYLHGQKNHDQRWYIVSVLSFALALLSKPAAIALPIALPILNHIAGRPFISKKSGIQLLPFLILSLAAGIVGLTGSGQQLRMGSSPLSENGLLALKSMGVAIVKFIAPVKLSVIYPFTDPVTITSPHIFLPALFVGVLFVIAWLLRRKEPTILWGLLLFVLLLAPTWASFRIGEDFGDVYFMADRYVYLPMIGLLLVVATVLIRATDRFGPGIVRGIATVILVAFGIVASAQATVWYDSRALFSHVLRHYPNAQAAHVNIGVLDADEGLPLEAISEGTRSSSDVEWIRKLRSGVYGYEPVRIGYCSLPGRA
jgi:protein O-mannosyl-transferase